MSYLQAYKQSVESPQQRMQAQIARIDEVLDRGAATLPSQDPALNKDPKQ